MSEQGSSGQEQAILSAVCALFDDGGFERATTGELQAFYQRLAALDARLLPPGDGETEIHRLALISVRLTEAQVDLSATRTIQHTRRGRVLTETLRYSGPVSLASVGGEWKVVDVFRDGRSLRGSVVRVDLEGLAGNAQITGGQGRFTGDRRLLLILNGINAGSAPIRISSVLLGSSRSGRRSVWREALVSLRELPPGETAFEIQAEVVASADPGGLRLLFRTESGLVDVRPASAAAITRAPVLVGRVRIWSLLSLASVVALVVGVGVATSVAGATLMLLGAAGLYCRQLAAVVRRRVRRPISTSVRVLIALLAIALILIVSGGPRYLANFDLSSSPPGEIFWPLIVIGVAGMIALRRLRKRWPRFWPFIQLISVTSILACFALLIGYGKPVSAAQVAAQEQRLGRVAIDALSTGSTTELLRNTYPGYRQEVKTDLLFGRLATHPFTFFVVGEPTISKGKIQYRLGVRHGSGGFRFTVESVERDRQQLIWRLIITGKAHKTIKL